MSDQPDLRRELLRGLRGGNNVDGNLYAGSDRANATRIVGLLWLLSAILAIAFLPFDPPTEAIGGAAAGGRSRASSSPPAWSARGACCAAARSVQRAAGAQLPRARPGGGAGLARRRRRELVREPLSAVARGGDRDPPAAPRARLSRRDRGRRVAAARIQRRDRRRGLGDGDRLPAAGRARDRRSRADDLRARAADPPAPRRGARPAARARRPADRDGQPARVRRGARGRNRACEPRASRR